MHPYMQVEMHIYFVRGLQMPEYSKVSGKPEAECGAASRRQAITCCYLTDKNSLFLDGPGEFSHKLIHFGVADFYTFATQGAADFGTQVRTLGRGEQDSCAGAYDGSAKECVK